MGSGPPPRSSSLPGLGTSPLPLPQAWEPGRGLSRAPGPVHPQAQAFAGSGRLCPRWLAAGELGGPQRETAVQPGWGTQWAPTKCLGNAASGGVSGRGRQTTPLSPPSRAAEVRGLLVPLPRACPPGSPMGGRLGLLSPRSLPAASGSRAGWRGHPGFHVSPPPTTRPGRNPECAAPTLGGPPQDQPITSYWQSWSWERSGAPRPGPAAARWRAAGRGLSSPLGATPPPPARPLEHTGPGTCRLGSGLCLPPAIAVETGA